MKKAITVLMLCLIFLGLYGCDSGEDTILFYYVQSQYAYDWDAPVILSEVREAPGREDDLEYLLTMYLEGPLDQKLASPFPKGSALMGFTYSDATMYVTLNEAFAQLQGIDHTVASACVAQTCFHLTAAEKVVIKCTSEEYGNQSITLRREDLILFDDSTATVSTEMTP